MAGGAYAAKPKGKVKGNLEFTAGGSSQDLEAFGGAAGPGSAGPGSGFAFRTNSEIAISASGKTDAGMKWKAEVQIEADTNVAASDAPTESAIDETWIRFSGSWGNIRLGNQDGAEDGYLVGGDKAVSKAGDGGIDGNWQDFIDARPVNGRLFDEPDDNLDSGDATKISYFTPRVGGVSAGVSFTPDTGAHGQATDIDSEADGDVSNTWGIGVDFKKKFGKVKVLVSGAVHLGDPEDETEEDLFTWGIGAHVGYGGWQVAGGYVDNGDSLQSKSTVGDDDATSWSAGIGYSQGPVHLGFSYLHSEVEDPTGTGAGGDDESDVFVISATYMLGGGARVFTDIFWLDTDSADTSAGATNNEGVGFLVGAQVKW
jgi:predicted porin